MVVNLWRYIFWRHVLPCFSSFSSLQGTQSNGEKKTTSAAYIYIQQQSKIVIKKTTEKDCYKIKQQSKIQHFAIVWTDEGAALCLCLDTSVNQHVSVLKCKVRLISSYGREVCKQRVSENISAPRQAADIGSNNSKRIFFTWQEQLQGLVWMKISGTKVPRRGYRVPPFAPRDPNSIRIEQIYIKSCTLYVYMYSWYTE